MPHTKTDVMETLIVNRREVFSLGDTGTRANLSHLPSGMTVWVKSSPSKENIKNDCLAGRNVRLARACSGTPPTDGKIPVYSVTEGSAGTLCSTHFLTMLCLISFLCLSTFCVYSQTTTNPTVSWSVVKTFDASKGTTDDRPSSLNVYADKIDWVDAKGKMISSFTITETKGTWTDFTQAGEISYILGGTDTGVVLISKNDEETIAHIVLTTETSATSFDLYLDGFTFLN